MRINIIICDFDGTITLKDSTDLLLINRFADPCWLDIENEWLKGKSAAGNVSSASCGSYVWCEHYERG